MRTVNVGIIGKGRIGIKLLECLAQDKEVCWLVKFMVDRKGVQIALKDNFLDENGQIIAKKGTKSIAEYCEDFGIGVVFLAISTKDDGEAARDIIVGTPRPVVTCEKGAPGNYWPEIIESARGSDIRYNASVGGGTMMLKKAKSHLDPFVRGFLIVLNGTINSFMDKIGSGYLPELTIEELRNGGYVDPLKSGEELSVLSTLNNEVVGDIPKKVAIFCNYVLGMNVRACDFPTDSLLLTRKDVEFLVNKSKDYRHFVSIERRGLNGFGYGDDPEIGAFIISTDKWTIKAGFRQLSPSLEILRVPGVTNIVVADEGSRGYNVLARSWGAGALPTVTTMIRDAYDILGL